MSSKRPSPCCARAPRFRCNSRISATRTARTFLALGARIVPEVRAKTEQFLDKARRKGRVCRALLTVGLCAAALARVGSAATAAPSPAIRIVAAENFYADIARQIAGPTALVRGVLDNPDADPHLFEPDIITARAVHG